MIKIQVYNYELKIQVYTDKDPSLQQINPKDPRYKNIELRLLRLNTQVYNGLKIQVYNDWKILVYNDWKIQVYNDWKIQVCNGLKIQVSNDRPCVQVLAQWSYPGYPPITPTDD